MKLEEILKNDIAAMGRQLIAKNLVAGSWGNISCLVDDASLVITPSGMGYEKQRAEDIVLIDFEGNVLEGKHFPSSESKLHTAIYRACPEAKAIIHTHSIYSVSYTHLTLPTKA